MHSKLTSPSLKDCLVAAQLRQPNIYPWATSLYHEEYPTFEARLDTFLTLVLVWATVNTLWSTLSASGWKLIGSWLGIQSRLRQPAWSELQGTFCQRPRRRAQGKKSYQPPGLFSFKTGYLQFSSWKSATRSPTAGKTTWLGPYELAWPCKQLKSLPELNTLSPLWGLLLLPWAHLSKTSTRWTLNPWLLNRLWTDRLLMVNPRQLFRTQLRQATYTRQRSRRHHPTIIIRLVRVQADARVNRPQGNDYGCSWGKMRRSWGADTLWRALKLVLNKSLSLAICWSKPVVSGKDLRPTISHSPVATLPWVLPPVSKPALVLLLNQASVPVLGGEVISRIVQVAIRHQMDRRPLGSRVLPCGWPPVLIPTWVWQLQALQELSFNPLPLFQFFLLPMSLPRMKRRVRRAVWAAQERGLHQTCGSPRMPIWLTCWMSWRIGLLKTTGTLWIISLQLIQPQPVITTSSSTMVGLSPALPRTPAPTMLATSRNLSLLITNKAREQWLPPWHLTLRSTTTFRTTLSSLLRQLPMATSVKLGRVSTTNRALLMPSTAKVTIPTGTAIRATSREAVAERGTGRMIKTRMSFLRPNVAISPKSYKDHLRQSETVEWPKECHIRS